MGRLGQRVEKWALRTVAVALVVLVMSAGTMVAGVYGVDSAVHTAMTGALLAGGLFVLGVVGCLLGLGLEAVG